MRILRTVLAVSAVFVAVACSDPCVELGDKICEKLADETACQRSREEIERDFNAAICENALTVFDRLYEDR